MANLMSRTLLPSTRDTRLLLVKWVIALLVPLLVFTFAWSGEAAVNEILLGFFMRTSQSGGRYDFSTLIGASIFFLLLYGAPAALTVYAGAAHRGKQDPILWWISMDGFIGVADPPGSSAGD